jgi:hypothetical protein
LLAYALNIAMVRAQQIRRYEVGGNVPRSDPAAQRDALSDKTKCDSAPATKSAGHQERETGSVRR